MAVGLKTAGIIFIIALIAVGALWQWQRSLIYFPDRAVGKPPASFERILIEGGETTTHSWWSPPRDAQAPVIIHFHGNGGGLAGRADIYRAMAHDGAGVLAVSYPGYNGDAGSPSERTFYRTAKANYRWLRSQGVAADRIVIMGQSIGSGSALYLATTEPAAGVILEAPFTSLHDVAVRTLRGLPRFFVRDHYPNLKRAGQLKIPLAWIHGTDDRIIPLDLGARVYFAAVGPKCSYAMNGAGHNDLWSHGIDEIVRQNARTMAAASRCWSEGDNTATARIC